MNTRTQTHACTHAHITLTLCWVVSERVRVLFVIVVSDVDGEGVVRGQAAVAQRALEDWRLTVHWVDRDRLNLKATEW